MNDVLAAALEVFAERGYAGLSIEAVAERANVNKTTVYRRWPKKSDLVAAALFRLKDDEPPAPDLGSLRLDLFELLRHRMQQMSSPRSLAIRLAVLVSRAEPELDAIIERLRRERPAIPAPIFERAVARGELPRNVDTRLLAETLIGTLHHRTFWKRESATPAFLKELIDLVVTGASGRRVRGKRGEIRPVQT